MSDCVHNAGPDPRPLAARLPRLDVLLDTSGQQDAGLARELPRLGRGRLRRVRTYHDIAPAVSAIFASCPQGAIVSVVVVATIKPLPEHRDEVIAAFERAEEIVHAGEDGCLLYALHEAPNGDLVMIEKYTDQAAFDAHSSGAGLAALVSDLKGKLGAPLDVKVLTPHPAGTAQQGTI